MTRDAKAAEKQRLAEALRANLRRRKAAQGSRAEREPEIEAADAAKGGPRDAPADDTR